MRADDFIFAMKYDTSKCKVDREFCIYQQQNNRPCVNNYDRCAFPFVSNPLCTCDDVRNCNRDYKRIKHNNEYYLFYRCRCGSLMRDNNLIEKLISKSKDFIVGDDLRELVREINEGRGEQSGSNDELLEFISENTNSEITNRNNSSPWSTSESEDEVDEERDEPSAYQSTTSSSSSFYEQFIRDHDEEIRLW